MTPFNNAAQNNSIDSSIDAQGNAVLHIAVRNNDTETVTRLLQSRANPNKQNNIGQSPIFEAIAAKNIDMVKLLIENGAATVIEDKSKRNPILWAIEQGCDIKFLESLDKIGLSLTGQNSAKKSGLHVAAASGRLDMVEYFLKKSVDPDVKDADGNTALHFATEKKSIDVMKKLLSKGATPTVRNNALKTPLYLAASGGDERVVGTLLAIPVVRQSVNEYKTLPEGRTPLIAAVLGEYAGIVDTLIKVGADVNQQDTSNRHSLFHAVEKGNVSIASMLIRAGADVEKCSLGIVKVVNKETKEPMLHRIQGGNYNQMLLVLYSAGANLNVVDSTGQSLLHKAAEAIDVDRMRLLIELRANPNAQDAQGKRPLDIMMTKHISAPTINANTLEGLRLLLANGADPNMSPGVGVPQSPLQYAVKAGKKDLVALFLKYNAIVDEPDRMTGATAWLLAIDNKQTEIGDMLLAEGADPMREDKQIRNALHQAAALPTKDTLERLLQMPGFAEKINAQDNAGNTPLHNACFGQRFDNIELLLKAGAKYDVPDAAGTTPMHKAVMANSTNLLLRLDTLLDHKVDWNMRNTVDGDTLLHTAARRGFLAVVKQLILFGADASIKNAQGLTPYDLAKQLKQEAAATTIEKEVRERTEAQQKKAPGAKPPAPPQ